MCVRANTADNHPNMNTVFVLYYQPISLACVTSVLKDI